MSPFSGLSVVANEGLVTKGSPNLKRFGILLRGLTQEGNPLPGNSASFSHLFWDAENVTLSKVVGDLQGQGLTHLVPINCGNISAIKGMDVIESLIHSRSGNNSLPFIYQRIKGRHPPKRMSEINHPGAKFIFQPFIFRCELLVSGRVRCL